LSNLERARKGAPAEFMSFAFGKKSYRVRIGFFDALRQFMTVDNLTELLISGSVRTYNHSQQRWGYQNTFERVLREGLDLQRESLRMAPKLGEFEAGETSLLDVLETGLKGAANQSTYINEFRAKYLI